MSFRQLSKYLKAELVEEVVSEELAEAHNAEVGLSTLDVREDDAVLRRLGGRVVVVQALVDLDDSLRSQHEHEDHVVLGDTRGGEE